MKNVIAYCTLSFGLVAAAASSVQAAPITITPATGLQFTLENLGLSSTQFTADGGAADTYDIKVTLTTNNTYASPTDLLASFAFDVSPVSLQFAALSSTTATGTWAGFTNIGVNGSSQCQGTQAGAVCTEETTSTLPNLVLTGINTYEWLFRVDLLGAFASTTALEVGVINGSTKTQYTGTGGSLAFSQGSEVTAVPEPGSLLLLGSGLVFAANRMRRRTAR
jgi:hypothetical protein